MKLTFILWIVTSVTENLQGTDEVESVKTLVQSKENLDWLKDTFTVLWNDCTHLAGIELG